MAANAALTAGELTNLRAGNHLCPAYLSYRPDTALGTAIVDATPTSMPIVQIALNSASANWDTALAGQTVKITNAAGTVLRGYYRLRLAPSDTVLYIDEVMDSDPGMIAQSSRTTGITAGDLCTAIDRWDLWSVKPYNTGDVSFQDYNIAVSTYNATPPPVVNISINGYPGHYCTQVANGATQAISAVASVTKWAPSVTGSSTLTYAWTYPASFTGVSGANTATLTATAPVGSHTIFCTVTDSIGGATVATRWIRIHSPADPPLNVNVTRDGQTRQGRKLTVRLVNSTISVIPPGALCVVWGGPTWNGADVASAAHSFAGYADTQPFVHQPAYHESTLDILGPGYVLDRLGGYAANFVYDGTTSTWEKLAASLCTLPFMIWWLLKWRTANTLRLFNFTPWTTSNLSARRKTTPIDPGSIYQQIKQLADMYFVNVASRSDGEIMTALDPSMLQDRSQVVTRGSFTNADYSDIRVEWKRRNDVGAGRIEGIYSDALNTDIETAAQAPGKKSYSQGPRTAKVSNKVCESQADFNQKAGRLLAHEASEYARVTATFPGNWDVFEVADMQRSVFAVPAGKSPTGAAISLTCIPVSVDKTWITGRRASITLECEVETDGKEGEADPPAPANTTLYGNYSNALDFPIEQPPATYGEANTDDPALRDGGLLLATQDVYVARASTLGFDNISPSSTQQTAVGTAIKLIADPYNYRRLILFCAQGALVCDDSTVANPAWTLVDLASSSAGGTWSQTLDLTLTDGGFEVQLGFGAWTSGTGWQGTTNGTGTSLRVKLELGTSFTVTSISVTYTIINNNNATPRGDDDIVRLFSGATQISTMNGGVATCGSATNRTVTGISGTGNQIWLALDSGLSPPCTGGSTKITALVVRGTGSNPFGGSGGSASDEVFISDIVGSPNRRGWFAWLSKKTVGGTDYVYVNTTRDYFASVVTSVQVAKYIATMTYTLSMSSYNSGASGVGKVTAGDPSGADAKVYSTTNWFASVSAGAALNTRGRQINVPYTKSGGTANAGTSPQNVYIKGISATNLECVNLAGGTTTVISGGSKYGIGPYSLHSFTLDGKYLAFVASDGTMRTSSDAGGTWDSKTAVTATGNVYGITGSPTNYQFLLGFGDRGLEYSTDFSSTWNGLHAAWRTFADAEWNSSTALIIISAFADLSAIYTRPVTT